jgi:HK97 family phage major capsid protein
VLGAPGTIVINKEINQPAGTLVRENISKMWNALPLESRPRARWIIGEDVEEQLEQLSSVIGVAGSAAPTAAALYMPQGTVGNAWPLLKGRPVHITEHSSALGSVGDIVLGDFGHYVLVTSEPQSALSAHVRFLGDESVWRFSLRLDGQSVFVSPIVSTNGNLRSPFVSLAPRS